jgi:thioredoxin-like negative regulator of GroEL
MKSDAAPQIVLPELLERQLPREQIRGWMLLLIWAPWSAAGRRLKRELETAAARPAELKLLSLRVEDAAPIVTALSIPSVPYLVLLHAGTEVARHPGDAPLPDVLEWVQARQSG